MSLDQILREKPNLDELCEHTRVGTKWYKFGVLLKLDIRELDAIEELNKDIDFKALKMFQLWLNTDPDATRKHVLNIMRKDVIGEIIAAEKYEKLLREQYDSLYIVTIQQVKLNQTDDENYQEKIKALIAMNNEKTMEIEKLKTQIKQYEADLQLKQKENDQLRATLKERKGTGEELLSPSLSIERLQQIELAQEIATSQKSQLRETEGLLKECVKGDTGNIQWYKDSIWPSVTLTSPTIEECEEVMCELKGQQQTGKQWWIRCNSSSSKSLLTLFNNINECLVKGLRIYDTLLDSCCVTEISTVLSYNKTIQELTLISSPVPSNSLEMIINAVSCNTTLKSLELWGDRTITDEDIPHIIDMIIINRTLEDLHFVSNNVTDIGIQQFSRALTKNKTLKTLFINGSFLRGSFLL